MSAQLDALTAAVAANTTATTALVTALQNAPPADDLTAVTAQIEQNTASVVAATPPAAT